MTDSPKEIWLLENKDLPEDDDLRIIWSADSDCGVSHEDYEVIGAYTKHSMRDELKDINDKLDSIKYSVSPIMCGGPL